MAMRTLLAPTLAVLVFLTPGFAHRATPARPTDLIPHYGFTVEIDGLDAGQFAEVTGLSMEVQVIEYQDGDDPLLRKRPGRAKFGDITLKKGYVASTVLNDWIEAARLGQVERRNVQLTLCEGAENQCSGDKKRWSLIQCFPKRWSLSGFDGESDVTEELVLVCDSFTESFVCDGLDNDCDGAAAKKPKEIVVVGSKVEEVVREAGLRSDGELVAAISEKVHEILEAAIRKVKENGGKTVKGNDIREVLIPGLD